MKIDYIVPYVDGTDPAWQNAFAGQKKKFGFDCDETELKKRYSENKLFKYHFRSVQKFMPWINRLHLLVQSESQVPKWIDRSAVHIVTHNEFIPAEFLPTFNSGVIECFLHKIPCLAELFVYANDDFYLFNETRPDDMFDGIMPLLRCKRGICVNGEPQYDAMCADMTKSVYAELNMPYVKGFFIRQAHGHTAYNKTIYGKIHDLFKKRIYANCFPFRTSSDTTQALFAAYYWLSTGGKYDGGLSIKYLSCCNSKKIMDFIQNGCAAQSVCINDNSGNDEILIFKMNQTFPEKSKYEI